MLVFWKDTLGLDCWIDLPHALLEELSQVAEVRAVSANNTNDFIDSIVNFLEDVNNKLISNILESVSKVGYDSFIVIFKVLVFWIRLSHLISKLLSYDFL